MVQKEHKVQKVLVLHGHGQSEDIIWPKIRHVRNIFRMLSDEIDFEFECLSGVLPAYPDQSDTGQQRVWGHGEPEKDRIKGLEESIAHILDTLDTHGPFCGVLGFSSGAAMSAILVSLLEKRKAVCGIPWKQTRHPPLLFAICLSGFMLENSCYQAIYDPKISTPVFHAIGIWDATVSPAQTIRLARQCTFPTIFEFEGGHYVPQAKEYAELKRSLLVFLQDIPEFSLRIEYSKSPVSAVSESTLKPITTVKSKSREGMLRWL
ncbi:hypothetical protein N7466_011137 [Penicillium verhagenii]|uniref:uncharacterized protein n=1 Tax=Penicillium verhagenii TaxID=1562060 RepID=UPI0025458380|nr:uncharacterized protein N7466_011137 [Penicillium verhagenii]KAJ5917583.1 hypothetical protein N7466_011137 [Penicillium verhagenii]